MRARNIGWVAAAVVALAAGGAAWRHHGATSPTARNPDASNTAVLGSYGQPPRGEGGILPRPPAPAHSSFVTTALDPHQSLALWTQEGHVYAARFAAETGWTDVHPLEDIAGEVDDLQLAGNGRGSAMAVWHHTLGKIESLRFARFEPDAGWHAPDVVPGVLPTHASPAARPRLALDAEGDATLQWPSAFAGAPLQVSRFAPGRGWSQPADVAAR